MIPKTFLLVREYCLDISSTILKLKYLHLYRVFQNHSTSRVSTWVLKRLKFRLWTLRRQTCEKVTSFFFLKWGFYYWWTSSNIVIFHLVSTVRVWLQISFGEFKNLTLSRVQSPVLISTTSLTNLNITLLDDSRFFFFDIIIN